MTFRNVSPRLTFPQHSHYYGYTTAPLLGWASHAAGAGCASGGVSLVGSSRVGGGGATLTGGFLGEFILRAMSPAHEGRRGRASQGVLVSQTTGEGEGEEKEGRTKRGKEGGGTRVGGWEGGCSWGSAPTDEARKDEGATAPLHPVEAVCRVAEDREECGEDLARGRHGRQNLCTWMGTWMENLKRVAVHRGWPCKPSYQGVELCQGVIDKILADSRAERVDEDSVEDLSQNWDGAGVEHTLGVGFGAIGWVLEKQGGEEFVGTGRDRSR